MIEKRLRLSSACAFMALLVAASTPQHGLAESANTAGEAEYHASKGLLFARRNNLKGAETELRRAVAICPHQATYLAGLGGVLGMEHKVRESSFYLEEALKLDPNDIETRRNLASSEWQLGRLQEAKRNLLVIRKVDRGDAPTLLLLGMVENSLKEYATAAQLLESVESLVKQQPAALLMLANSYYRTGQPERARRTLKDLFAFSHNARDVYLGGRLAAEAGDYETAEEFFTSILPAYPDRSALGYQLAVVQYKAGHLSESEKTLLELVDNGRQTSEVYSLLAWCYRKQGKSKEAVQAVDEAIRHVTPSEPEYLNSARVFLENQQFSAAEIVAKRALQLNPKSEEAYELEGEAELDSQFFNDAVHSYSRAVRLDPSSGKANLGLAMAQWGNGQIAQATATFEQGLRRFPNDPAHYVQYARMLSKLGEEGNETANSRAVTLLKAAIALCSSQAEPYFLLGKLLLNRGDNEEALRDLRVAATLDPNRGEIHYALWRADRRLGNTQEASKEFAEYRGLSRTGSGDQF